MLHGQILFQRHFFKFKFCIMWGELYENSDYRTDFSFELQIIKVFEIRRLICMNFSSWDVSSN
jgi:hypothetical protein